MCWEVRLEGYMGTGAVLGGVHAHLYGGTCRAIGMCVLLWGQVPLPLRCECS